MSEELTKATTLKTMGEFLQKYQSQIASLVPKHIDAEKMLRIGQVALSRNPKLLECTPISVLDCVIKAAQLGLELNGPLGQAYMIPYRNTRTERFEAQFQPGYRGLIELARRSGEISYVDAHVIHQGDYFAYEYGTQAQLIHRPSLNNRGEAIGAYAIVKRKDGNYQFLVMSEEEINQAKAVSKAKESGPWVSWPDEMRRKTPTKRLLKYVPASAEVNTVLGYDDQAEAGLPQDLTINLDQERIRYLTENKAKALKEKITAAHAHPTPEFPLPPPVSASVMENMIGGPIPPIMTTAGKSTPIGESFASMMTSDQPVRRGRGRPAKPKGEMIVTNEVPGPPIETEFDVIPDENLTEETAKPPSLKISEVDRLAFIGICQERKLPRNLIVAEMGKHGYKNTGEILQKNFDELMQWAKTAGADTGI